MYVCPECGAAAEGPGACPRDGVPRDDGGNDSFLGLTMGSYRVTRLIGAGGMGRVYRAVQPEIGGRVAIKVLSEACALEPRFQERFFAEARAVNLIRHEKIVNIVDLARLPDGRPYIVMEYLDGSPLSAVFRNQQAPLPLAGFARLMLEVLDGVGAAHDKGVVHRDLKPDNIFVSPNGHATVLDFGIAKLAEADSAGLTQTGAVLGTPKYMSPEQVMGLPADARADVYSLGVILYEGVVGAPPFASGPTFELMRQHVEVAPTPPSMRRPDTPPGIERVIMQALAKQPERRFTDAHDMRRALLASMAELPNDSLEVVGSRPQELSRDPSARAVSDDLATRTAPPKIGGPTPLPAMSMPMMSLPMMSMPTRAAPPTIAPATMGPGTIAHTASPAPVLPLAPAPHAVAPRRAPMWPLVLGALVGFGALGAVGSVLVLRSGVEGDTKQTTAAVKATSDDDPASPEKKKTKKNAAEIVKGAAPTEEQLARFDVDAWIQPARSLAHEKFAADAELTMIYVPVHLPDGYVDLRVDGVVVYYFRSPSHEKDDDGCATSVSIGAEGISTHRYAEALCDRPFLDPPRCTPTQVIKRAMKGDLAGSKSKQGTASYFFVQGMGLRWAVTATDGKAGWVEDDCK